jgi:hypothetical protein
MNELIQRALKYAEDKDAMGLLVWDEIPEFDNDEDANEWWLTPFGDKETVYSIANLFAADAPVGMTEDECRSKLEDALTEKYPNKCY